MTGMTFSSALPTRSTETTILSPDKPYSETNLSAFIEIIPEYTLLLNHEGKILSANTRLLKDFSLQTDDVVGKAPGDVLHCIFRNENANGCMSGNHCITCGAREAFVESMEQKHTATGEFYVTTELDGMTSFDFEVEMTPILLENMSLIVCTMKDIYAEKRRRALERSFFHDVMNKVTGICNFAALLSNHKSLSEESIEKYASLLGLTSDMLVDDINFQRKLLSAEKGTFRPEMSTIDVPSFMKELLVFYSNTPEAQERNLALGEVDSYRIVCDASILKRILGNLIINALEAIIPGETVTINCVKAEKATIFSVHNPGIIPDKIKPNIFKRSFSTKSQEGRGVGTYSVKLFGERYLYGIVDFLSREPDGTTFYYILNDDVQSISVNAGSALKSL